jgi:hypothetical protein
MEVPRIVGAQPPGEIFQPVAIRLAKAKQPLIFHGTICEVEKKKIKSAEAKKLMRKKKK